MNSFNEMPLADELKSALQTLNFTQATEIQAAVIPVATAGTDVMACAETGSGKTGAYGIPMVSRLLENPEMSALVLAPTRELVQQIAEFLRSLTRNCERFNVCSVVGGADMRRQTQALRKHPRIIVATPGRLTDHLRRRTMKLDRFGMLVLDEGDRMLDMGFEPQLIDILAYLPKQRQTSLFSATVPDRVRLLSKKYLSKPQSISIGRISLPVDRVKQSVVELSARDKNDRVMDELNQRKGSIIVFLRTQGRTDSLKKALDAYGYKVDLIHGGRTQGQRNRAIQNFRKGESRILCATDIAARGIDVPHVEHVINYDLPRMDEDYVHRIGRTARNGAEGEAVSFVTPEDHLAWLMIAKKYRIAGVELKGRAAASTGSPKKASRRKRKIFAERATREKSADGDRRRREPRSNEFRRDTRTSSPARDSRSSEPRREGRFNDSGRIVRAERGRRIEVSSERQKRSGRDYSENSYSKRSDQRTEREFGKRSDSRGKARFGRGERPKRDENVEPRKQSERFKGDKSKDSRRFFKKERSASPAEKSEFREGRRIRSDKPAFTQRSDSRFERSSERGSERTSFRPEEKKHFKKSSDRPSARKERKAKNFKENNVKKRKPSSKAGSPKRKRPKGNLRKGKGA